MGHLASRFDGTAARMGVRPWLGLAVAAAALAALAVLAPDAAAQSPTGGPDLGGYTFVDSTQANGPTWSFVNIATNGTQLAPPLGDDTETQLTLPFTFLWYGTATTTIKVSSNGFICFNPVSAGDCIGCCSYSGTPGSANPNRFVAAYYGDLHCNSMPTCAYSHTWGTAPNRVFVVMLNGEGCFPYPSGCNLNFEYKIFEGSNCVEVHYDQMTDPNGSNKFAGTEGQSPSGTFTGLQHYFAAGPGALANRAVRYCQTTAPPPACTPATQTIVPGGSATLSAAGGTTPYTWSVSPSFGVTPSTGSGPSFTATYANAGLHTVTVTGGGSFSCTVNVVAPGCGYTVDSAIPYALDDISTTGAGQSLWDDSSTTHTLPFAFEFCNVSYTQVRTSSNGYVCFGSASCTQFTVPCAPPCTSLPRPAVYGYMSDLFPPGCNGGSTQCTWVQVKGTAPNRVFLYQMRNVPYCCSTSPQSVSFEIKLFEGTNCFEVHYGGGAAPYPGVSDPPGWHFIVGGYQSGGSAPSGYTYAASSPGFQRNDQAWSACPVPPFRANTDPYTLNEDQPEQPLAVLANDQNTAPGPITITGVTQGAKGSVRLAGSTVYYTPFTDRNGADSFTYTITNTAGQTSTGTVAITINPVNDAPSFVGSPDQILHTPASGVRVVPGWGQQVQPAPTTAADEAGQEVRFIVSSNSDAGVFLGNPEAALTGSATDAVPLDPPVAGAFARLRFAPSGNTGLATVCFRAVDNGGAAPVTNSFGATVTGVDTGAEQCVPILMNAPPVAYFEPSSTAAAPRDGVTFDPCPGALPRCTTDLDGTLVMYLWEFGDGATSAAIEPTHAFPAAGEYVVRLTVWDNHGSQATYQRAVDVQWTSREGIAPEESSNGPPPADAGEDRTVPEATEVRLAGTVRGDATNVLFRWTQVAGPDVGLRDADSATPTFLAPRLAGLEPVDLVFALRAEREGVLGEPDYVVVHVVSANDAPVIVLAPVAPAVAGSTVVLDASGSTDADGDAMTFRWQQEPVAGETLVALPDPSSPRLSFRAPDRPGLLHFRLTVGDGRATSVDLVVVEVRPTAVAAAPLDGADGLDVPSGAAQAEPSVATAGSFPWAAAGLGLLAMLAAAGLVAYVVVRLRK